MLFRGLLEPVIQRPYCAIGVAAAVTALGVLSAYPFTMERLMAASQEGGWIETGTAVTYFAVALVLLLVQSGNRWFLWHSAFIVSLMGARELDLHKAFTSDSVLTTRFYFRDHAELPEKLISGAVMTVLAILVLYYLRHWRRLWDGLWRRSAAAISIVTVIMLALITKSLDAFGRLMSGFGIELSFDTDRLRIIEESGELAIPVVMALALAQYWLAQSTECARLRPNPLEQDDMKSSRLHI